MGVVHEMDREKYFIIQRDLLNDRFIKLYENDSSDIHYLYDEEFNLLLNKEKIELKNRDDFIRALNSFEIIKLNHNGSWNKLKEKKNKIDIHQLFQEELNNIYQGKVDKEGFQSYINEKEISEKMNDKFNKLNQLFNQIPFHFNKK